MMTELLVSPPQASLQTHEFFPRIPPLSWEVFIYSLYCKGSLTYGLISKGFLTQMFYLSVSLRYNEIVISLYLRRMYEN
jgi:hypothetical protein